MSPDGRNLAVSNFNWRAKMPKLENMKPYFENDGDEREWGTFRNDVVLIMHDGQETNVTEEFLAENPGLEYVPHYVEKTIVVSPKRILSGQAHTGVTTHSSGRSELWTVVEGTMTVLLNGEELTVKEGQSIFIPNGSMHCMGNKTDKKLVVKEIQKGECIEEDNDRIIDQSDRPVFTKEEMAERLYFSLQKRYANKDFVTDDVSGVSQVIFKPDLDLINYFEPDPSEKESVIQLLMHKVSEMTETYQAVLRDISSSYAKPNPSVVAAK